MQGEVKVDDAFVAAVMQRSRDNQPHRDAGDEEVFRGAIEIVLSVAAERGLVVPEDAPRAWAVAGPNGEPSTVRLFATHTAASNYAIQGATVVRVAIVEIKEDGK